MPVHSHIVPVELDKAYRLLNHGPTVLISAQHAGQANVMAAAWACALDFNPPKVSVVIDKMTATRGLIEKSGLFVMQVPTVSLVQTTYTVGSCSLTDTPDKLERAGITLFQIPGHEQPFVAGCSAWLVCELIPEPHNQTTYDLFIGQVIAAWADSRVFSQGHWHFETADPSLRSVHYVAGGHFYAIGDPVKAQV